MNDDQRPLRVYSLRTILPLILVGAFIPIVLALSVLENRNYVRASDDFSTRVVRGQLRTAVRDLDQAARRGATESLTARVAELGLEPALDYAALLDADDRVIAATRFAWRGRPARQTLPDFPGERIATSRSSGAEAQWTQDDGHYLLALAPVTLPAATGELRASRRGLLLLRYDLSPLMTQARHNLSQQLQIFGLITIAALLTLTLIVRRLVVAPVNRLRIGMARIGEGDFSTPPQFRGHGEFRQLGDTLNRMAAQLQTSVAALAESEARYRQLSDAAHEGLVLHADGLIIDANRAAEVMFGFPSGGLVGLNIFALISPEGQSSARARVNAGIEGTWEQDMIRVDGSSFPAEVKVRVRQAEQRQLRVVALRDISERLSAQAEIRQLAYTDALTGLPNRRQFLEQVQNECRQGRRAAVAVLNLNGFTAINESLGMAAGDEALRTLARRLQEGLRPEQCMARVDGDSFALLLSKLDDDLERASEEVARVCERLLAVIAQPMDLAGHAIRLDAAAGVVMLPNDSQQAPELLREAETAMNRAKTEGGDPVRFFSHSLQEAASARLLLRTQLRQALQDGQQLLLHYQPQVDASGRLLGMEALVRWRHPERGLIPPGLFIPEAESSGLVVPLGNWVLEEACRQMQMWREAGLAAGLTMAINVSPRQFREADFIQRVTGVLARVGLEAAAVELELTESVVADDLDATVEKMHALRGAGLRFALDDFGTGYSSLAYLKRLPIDVLKIDRSFIMDIAAAPRAGAAAEEHSSAALVDAIIAMATHLQVHVIAEGVETAEQLQRLQHCGCTRFQGYHFSRPLDAAGMEDRLRQAAV